MKLGIMQPYLFPYIGYFQLINAVDTFVIYDDVNYIKQGWINRNRILMNNASHYFTLSLKEASSFKKICEIEVGTNIEKLKKTLLQVYCKAPYFAATFSLLHEILDCQDTNLSHFVTNSLQKISRYIGIETKFVVSSELNISCDLCGQDRVIKINEHFHADTYINAIGGKELYSREAFAKHNIKLQFLKTDAIEYKQFSREFIPNLSIIDVLMFNSLDSVREFLNRNSLV